MQTDLLAIYQKSSPKLFTTTATSRSLHRQTKSLQSINSINNRSVATNRATQPSPSIAHNNRRSYFNNNKQQEHQKQQQKSIASSQSSVSIQTPFVSAAPPSSSHLKSEPWPSFQPKKQSQLTSPQRQEYYSTHFTPNHPQYTTVATLKQPAIAPHPQQVQLPNKQKQQHQQHPSTKSTFIQHKYNGMKNIKKPFHKQWQFWVTVGGVGLLAATVAIILYIRHKKARGGTDNGGGLIKGGGGGFLSKIFGSKEKDQPQGVNNNKPTTTSPSTAATPLPPQQQQPITATPAATTTPQEKSTTQPPRRVITVAAPAIPVAAPPPQQQARKNDNDNEDEKHKSTPILANDKEAEMEKNGDETDEDYDDVLDPEEFE